MIHDEHTFAAQTLLYSITNPLVDNGQAIDTQSPFDFYNFIKYSRKESTPTQFNVAYQQYLKEWSKLKKQSKQQQEQVIKDNYVELLKDITLNYLTYEERRFIKSIDFNDSSDLDIVLPFYSKKLREICKFYTDRREKLKHQIRKFQEKGNFRSVKNAITESVTDYVALADDDNLIDNIPNIKVENIINNLQIEIEELYDVYSNYFDISPTLDFNDYDTTDAIRIELYTSNVNDVEYDLFIAFDDAIKRYLLENLDIFLQGLGEDFAVNYNINAVKLDCKPDEKLYDLITGNKAEAARVLNLRKRLIQKYIGADFYYIKTGLTTTNVTSGILFKADNPSGNLLNRHFPTTASVEEKNNLITLRDMGLFFRPEKNGLLYFSAPESRYKIDSTKLEPNKVYIYPDPSLYGNTTGLTNNVDINYPLVHIQDYATSVSNASYFHAEGDVKTSPYEQSFYAYFSRNQLTNNTQTNLLGLSSNLASVVNCGRLVQWSEDIFGNQYGLFAPSDKRAYIDTTTSTTNSTTAYEYYDGGILTFYSNGYVPEPISTDVIDWVYPNIFASNYYYNALFDGGVGHIKNGIMIRALRAPRIYDGLYFTLSNADFSTILNNTAVDNILINYDTGILIDCGEFTDPIIYEGNLTLTYITSSIQYKELDGGPLIRNETGDIARDTGKNIFLTQVISGCESQFVDQHTQLSNDHTVYIRDVVTGITQPLSTSYKDVLQKYNLHIQNELLSSVRTFSVYNDIVHFRTSNYFVIDKITYTNIIESRSATNSYIYLPATNIAEIADPLFFENQDYAITCVLSVVSAESNDCMIQPTFYKIHKDATLRTISISGLSLDSLTNTLGVKIQNIVKPMIVYSSRNSLFALLATLRDANNMPYIYQMYFKYTDNQIVVVGVRVVSFLNNVSARTINWYDDTTLDSVEINNVTAPNTQILVDNTQGALIING